MQKILSISTLESLPWGGSEQLWSDMALHLLQEGYEVMTNTIAWPETNTKLQQIAQAGGKTTFRPNPHLGGNIATSITNRLKAMKWKKEVINFAPDIIFINQGGTFDYALHVHGDWFQALGVPYVILSNLAPESLYLPEDSRRFFKGFFNKAKEVWFVSRRNKEVAERALAGDISNAHVITNPIKIQDAPASYPATSTWHMATVARLETEIKGYDILIETFAQPQWRERNYQVNIYGSGAHQSYLQELVAYRGLQERIIFKGFVNNITELWATNHIMLMPSRGEGTPLSLLEAGYCSRAAVVTDVGGNADVVTEGLNGFVAESPTINSFSAAMERAWQQRESWEALGINARARIDERYSSDIVAQAVKRFLG